MSGVPKFILVCGDRGWTDYDFIAMHLAAFDVDRCIERVIHGAAPGADTLAGQWFLSTGRTPLVYPADWQAHGRAAGPKRNQLMLDKLLSYEDKDADEWNVLVVAFHDNIEASKGTKDMVRRAKRRVLTYVIGHNGEELFRPAGNR